jgi:triphosphoribosyl-dephospho-CoA synthase
MRELPPSLTPSASPGQLAQWACVLEVCARKPGNVHPGARFDDLDHVDFLLAASAIVRPLDRAQEVGVGQAVLDAVVATQQVVATNVNLGLVLLLAPLAAVPAAEDLEAGVERILAATTIADARAAYRAIRLAQPGGLGSVPEQDVYDEPTRTLREVMQLAADRDLVARQYANGYAEVFHVALPALCQGAQQGHALETAIIAAQLALLARERDTLIERKCGRAVADEASRRAVDVLGAGGLETPEGLRSLAELDAWLRADGHARNPGTTADLVAAALFAALRNATIQLPRPAGRFRAIDPT